MIIDWELAAIASGSIALAAITLGWDLATLTQSDARYVRATSNRLGLDPDKVRKSIDAARRHVIARVVGGLPTPDPADSRRIRRLRSKFLLFAELVGASPR